MTRQYGPSALVAASAVAVLLTACSGHDLSAPTTSSTGTGTPSAPSTPALQNTTAAMLPTGMGITPLAIPSAVQQYLNPQIAANPNWLVSEAVKAQLSPDGNTLAVITAGYNTLYNSTTGAVDTASSTQYVFIYDVSGANKANPKFVQAISQTNAFFGLAWNGNNTLYGTGGADDKVYVYTRGSAAPSSAFSATASIALGHTNAIASGTLKPNAGGLAVSADGKTLLVANNYNDSISVIDATQNKLITEYDLRPYNTSGQQGVAGGEYPWAVTMTSNNMAFVSSARDREVVVLNMANPAAPAFVSRIALGGNAYGMALSPDQSKLYVAEENSDRVGVIDTKSLQLTQSIALTAPNGVSPTPYSGRDTIAVTVSPDGKTLYAVNNGDNSVAVVPLTGSNANTVAGYLPTAYAPKDIAISSDSAQMYIINGKSITGPNTQYTSAGSKSNQYQFGLEKASLVSAPVPSATALGQLTTVVNANNNYSVQEASSDSQTMQFLHDHIKHVIYIIKENRTFDQVLGDLGNGSNGSPSLTMYGRAITPNFHAIASTFVTLDNFMDPADGSMDGWSWAQHAHITPQEEMSQQENYAGVSRGMSYEAEGQNRNVAIGLGNTAGRDAGTATGTGYSGSAQIQALPGGVANLLPGTADVSLTDAPFGYQQSSIYDAVLQAGGTIRDYGGMVNNVGSIGTAAAPNSNPCGTSSTVMALPNKGEFVGRTDTCYLGYNQSYPDTFRETEWNREFQQFVTNGNLPNFELVRMGTDHTGNYYVASTGAGNVGQMSAPEMEQADNDFAVGKLIETVSKSPYASNTLIVVIEDDAQAGSDHVDSHRSTAYIVGPYVKQGKVVSTAYTQVNAMRTMEDVLGTPHINVNTAYARPMADVFDTSMSPSWTYTAVASTILQGTNVGTVASNSGAVFAQGKPVHPLHGGTYWAAVQREIEKRGYTFAKEDQIPPALFNEVLWKGVMGNKPYPRPHSVYAMAAAKVPHGRADADGDDD